MKNYKYSVECNREGREKGRNAELRFEEEYAKDFQLVWLNNSSHTELGCDFRSIYHDISIEIKCRDKSNKIEVSKKQIIISDIIGLYYKNKKWSFCLTADFFNEAKLVQSETKHMLTVNQFKELPSYTNNFGKLFDYLKSKKKKTSNLDNFFKN